MIVTARRKMIYIISIICVSVVVSLILTQNIFQSFLPRSFVFNNAVLTFLQAVSCSFLCLALVGTSIINFAAYNKIKNKHIPLSGMKWLNGIYCIFLSVVFGLEFMDIFHPYYWIDSIVKLITAVLAVIVTITQYDAYKGIQALPPDSEYERLIKEIEELQELKRKVDDV